MLRRFLYVSVSCLPKDGEADEIARIVDVSRGRNADGQVTGALIFSGVRFAQYLEGPRDGLSPIVESIVADPRHERVTPLWDDEVEQRLFSGWSLSYAGASFYVDRHIKALVGAPPGDPTTQRNTIQLVRLLTSLTKSAAMPSKSSHAMS